MTKDHDYITIGSSPVDEPCAQLGEPGYAARAQDECEKFIALARKLFGEEPPGARLAVKWFPHDFGSYAEVVCWYHDGQESEIYALAIEGDSPTTWDDSRPRSWKPSPDPWGLPKHAASTGDNYFQLSAGIHHAEDDYIIDVITGDAPIDTRHFGPDKGDAMSFVAHLKSLDYEDLNG